MQEDCVCIAQQQAAEFAQVSDIKAPDYVDRVWKGFYLRLRQPRARLWAEPFDIVCCDAASEDALLYEEGNGRYFLASHAWHAVSRHSWLATDWMLKTKKGGREKAAQARKAHA
eukprot:1160479-Pelagomonas_calceolata.AAC.15